MSRADVFVSLAPRGMSLLLSRLHSVHHKSSSLGTSEIQCTGRSTFYDLSSERTFEYKWHSWTTGLRGNGYRWVFRYMSIINLEEYNQIDLMNWITFIWSNNVGQHVCLQWGLQWRCVRSSHSLQIHTMPGCCVSSTSFLSQSLSKSRQIPGNSEFRIYMCKHQLRMRCSVNCLKK